MILYFSATGNCKYVASRLAKADEQEMLSIVDCIREGRHTFKDESIGIVLPTYFWGLPSIVKEFLEKASFQTGYLYLAATYGTTPGAIGAMADKAIRGCKISAYYSVRMADTWTPVFDLSTPEKTAKYMKNTAAEIDVFMGDVRDPNGVRTAMRGQERVFHLAALIAIPFSYHSPDSYVDTNIKGTLNILNAARELDTQRVLVTSTSEVYGTAQYVPIDEKHPYQGQSPYSATKIGADRLAESFYRSFDLPVTIVRPFNTYGPRQSGRAIIPTIITQLLAGQTEIKLGSLTPTRDFNYVKDTANGFMTIADCDAAIGQELNIATGVEHSIGDLANELIAQINPNAKIVCEAERLRPEKSEVNRLLGDATKLRSMTGWEPRYTFAQGLAETIDFLRGNLDQYKVGQYIL